METKYTRTKIGNGNMYKEHIIGLPITSSEYAISYKSSQRALLQDLNARYQLMPSPSKRCTKIRHGRLGSIIRRVTKVGQTMDIFVQGIREHVKLGPKLSETVKGKWSLGASILQFGGVDKVFKRHFNMRDDEMLLKASQCYLSTTAGPIAGLLFISNNRVAFCSEKSIKLSSPTGKLLKAHYKVMIPLRKIKRAIESENVKRPMQKYVHLVTEDNFNFWFMGFLNHKRTLKYIQQAIHQVR